MMNVVVNSINTLSAGTQNVTANVLSEFAKIDGLTVYVPDVFESYEGARSVPCSSGRLKPLVRLAFELLFPFITYIKRAEKTLILANYSPFPCRGEKTVLVRNPYLVDGSAGISLLSFGDRIKEKLRATAFKLTLKTCDRVVVQSTYMKEKLLECYTLPGNVVVDVLPNPVSSAIISAAKTKRSVRPGGTERINIIYPSRYYPHKNHEALIEFCKRNINYLIESNVRFTVTVTEPENKAIITRMMLFEGSEKVLNNIGEVSQIELIRHYLESDALIFPSKSETFGNALVEAQCFGLPIIVNNLPYAWSVCPADSYYVDFDGDPAVLDEQLIKSLNEVRRVRTDGPNEPERDSFEAITTAEWVHRFIGA